MKPGKLYKCCVRLGITPLSHDVTDYSEIGLKPDVMFMYVGYFKTPHWMRGNRHVWFHKILVEDKLWWITQSTNSSDYTEQKA